jgi:hypothetical protein
MAVDYQRIPHPHIAVHKKSGPPKTGEGANGFNGRLAVILTSVVGTMWCAYAFAVLALVALPSAIEQGSVLAIVTWVSQTFIQLVMLSVIMVGQAIMSKASDERAEMTYKDADATFHESEQIQLHLKAQDDALDALLNKVAALEASLEAALAARG